MAQKKPAVAPAVDKSINLTANEIVALRKAIEVGTSGIVPDNQKAILKGILLRL